MTRIAAVENPVSVLDMTDREKGSNDRQGMASASDETRENVSRKGGEAPHPHGSGMQNASEETKERVARLGGEASHKNDDKGSASSRGGSSERGSSSEHGRSSEDTKKSSSSSSSKSGSSSRPRGRD